MPGRHPAKIFLFYFYNFFAGCRTAGAPGKEFFIFFRNFFAGCQVMGHPAKNFFFEKTLPGALDLALGKAGNSFQNSQLCRVPGPGHPAKPQKLIFFILFFDSIITNTAYKRYISHLKHHKDNIAHIYHIHLITNSIPHIYITSRIQYLTYTTSQT